MPDQHVGRNRLIVVSMGKSTAIVQGICYILLKVVNESLSVSPAAAKKINMTG